MESPPTRGDNSPIKSKEPATMLRTIITLVIIFVALLVIVSVLQTGEYFTYTQQAFETARQLAGK